jgi:hypothetical protein
MSLHHIAKGFVFFQISLLQMDLRPTPRDYSLRPKINAIVGLCTQTNAKCKITKLPLVLSFA